MKCKTKLLNREFLLNSCIYLAALIPFTSTIGCSGKATLRTLSSQDSSQDSPQEPSRSDSGSRGTLNGNSSADHENQPAEESPEITGMELVDVHAKCLSVSCASVRFDATVKSGTKDPVSLEEFFAAHKLEEPVWEFQARPEGTYCVSEGSFKFSPICTGAEPLNEVKGKVTIRDKAGHGVVGNQSVSTITSENLVNPVDEGGKVILVDQTTKNMTPQSLTEPLYPGATARFSKIWQHLDSSGLYVTNTLYARIYGGSLRTEWSGAMTLCQAVNSGDGAGKWRMPTIEELCGGIPVLSGVGTYYSCRGGMVGDRVLDLITWPMLATEHFWSSSDAISQIAAWFAQPDFEPGHESMAGSDLKENSSMPGNNSVFCVR